MYDIIFSYAVQDKFIAEALCRHLEEHSLKCWCSHLDSALGTAPTNSFQDVLSPTSVIILLYSVSSNNSADVLSDVFAAIRSGCTIVPFRLDHSVPCKKLSDTLADVQWLDGTNGTLEENAQALSSYIRMLIPSVKSNPVPVSKKSSPISVPKNSLLILIAIAAIAAILLLFTQDESPEQTTPETSIPATQPTVQTTVPAETEPTAVISEIDYLAGTYCGTLENSIPHGEGTLTWPEGYYEGSFLDGYPCGSGTFYFSDGRSLQGDSWAYGTTEPYLIPGFYQGMLLNNQAAGYGILSFQYDACYQGTFMEDHPYGDGMYTYLNCSCIYGFWDWEDQIQSTWLIDRQGAEMFYTGMSCDGVFSGYGYLVFSSGGTFLGEFSCNNPAGWGVYSYRNPSSEDKKMMEGTNWTTVFDEYRYKNHYYGLKLDGKWQGFGIGILESGYAYCGEILNDYRDGFGELYTRKDVLERRGIYRKGELSQSLPKS